MEEEFVTIKGKKFYVEDRKLDLSSKEINDISEIKDLESLTNLRELDLSYNSINVIQGLETLTNLEKLDLSHNSIEEIQGLENLKDLLVLDLSWNKITEIKGLETLTNLIDLDLWDRNRRASEGVYGADMVNYYGDNPIRPGEWEIAFNWDAQEIVNYCKDKKEGKIPFITIKGEKYYVGGDRLNLCHWAISDVITDINEIEGLEKLTHLRELNLKNNDIKEIKGLDALINLRELDLRANRIDEIKGLDNLKNLDHLYLHNNPIDDNVIMLAWEAPGLLAKYCRDKKEGKLQFVTVRGQTYYVMVDILDLSGLGITDISEIQGLENLTSLRELNLSDNQITEIRGLENLTNLYELDLRKNPIQEDEQSLVGKSAQEVVKYCQEKARKLKNALEGDKGVGRREQEFVTYNGKKYHVKNDELDLQGNNITDITEIKGLESLINLKELDLSDNKIKEIKGLEQLTQLKKLNLYGNQIVEIKGLENFTNLKKIKLEVNPIRAEERYLVDLSAQKIVKYCQEKASKAKEGG